ncbi:hypothetical protein H257_07900 [Aphanomyces astaci]|uniref:Tc1-like transposase DDE domain-containing protein n=1 Tax=Aphanomyces astaci TaxID=112090 RepID=W4GGY8_APHAT|nr:hypothetical protein H257_07900 [Aphanomyces astaci]ETV78314.1 hypothetical protein H257_07900 [Aphanomyces astaci]|eukprot:XP_009831895.1 hypothetical protein H257_07900 [Aphanomyces astaci]
MLIFVATMLDKSQEPLLIFSDAAKEQCKKFGQPIFAPKLLLLSFHPQTHNNPDTCPHCRQGRYVAGVIQCNTQDRGSSASCLRIVQIYLEKLGFKRGKRRDKATYSVSSAYAAAQDIYVQKMNNLDANTPVVYMDESYIHHHYTRHQDSLFDPTDDAPLKEKQKGRRMYFIAGIMAGRASGADSTVVALDIFEGGKKSKDDPKDYHTMFNHTYFLKWLERAMDCVEALG